MNATMAVEWIADRLAEHFGAAQTAQADPVETLVLTILSQNTNDTNRDRAYASLLKTFGTLEAVSQQPVDSVAAAIRVGGLHQQKARSILHALQRIERDQGRLDLAFLGSLPWPEALTWLLNLPGVGKKTAGIVLLFSFDRPFFPVDTHIRRIAARVGLITAQGDPHNQLNALLPPDPGLMRSLHLHLIELGRLLCHPRNPECEDCPLRLQCDFGTIGRLKDSKGAS